MAEPNKPLSDVEKQIVVFSFYRDAEIRGARLLFNLLGHLKDRDSQLKLTRHLADETTHAWLWTKRIYDLGGEVLDVPDGYQRRLGMRAGVPKTLVDLLALTVVVESRAQSRYLANMEKPGVEQETLDVLKAVTKDEVWHLSWIEKKMMDIARGEGNEQKAVDALSRYREIDRQVWETFAQSEDELMRGTWVSAASSAPTHSVGRI